MTSNASVNAVRAQLKCLDIDTIEIILRAAKTTLELLKTAKESGIKVLSDGTVVEDEIKKTLTLMTEIKDEIRRRATSRNWQ